MSDIISVPLDRTDIDRFPATTTAILSLAALLWLVLLEGWLPMPAAGVDAPMTASGVPELIATSNGLSGVGAYLLLWGTTTMAILLPSLAPIARWVREASCEPFHRAAPAVVAFVGAYAFVWTATGVVPLAFEFLVSIRELATGSGRLFTGGLLAIAGAYQLSPLKRDLLERCRCSLDVDHCPRVADGVRAGLKHAIRCIGCTWALFALVVGLGSANALVTIGLALVVSLERFAPKHDRYALATGVLFLVAAVGTVILGVPFGG